MQYIDFFPEVLSNPLLLGKPTSSTFSSLGAKKMAASRTADKIGKHPRDNDEP